MSAPDEAKERRAAARWQNLSNQMAILGGFYDYAEGVDQVAVLIAKVRAVTDAPGYRDVQLELVDALRSAEARVRAARRALGHGLAPYEISFEEMQRNPDARTFVAWHRRVTQLRGVGDAVAWRMLDFHRGYLAALAGGRGAGYLVDKSGLGAELRAFEQSWSDGVPTLLTTVTRCLRVGDLIDVPPQGSPHVREIKARPARRGGHRAQTVRRSRTQATLSGIRQPDIPRIALCAAPIRHHLGLLREQLTPLIERGGLALKRLPHADLLMFDTTAWLDAGRNPSWQEAQDIIQARVEADLKQEWVRVYSFERVDLDDFNAPFAIYPFDPQICAALMFGYLQVWTHLNLSVVMDVLAHRGFTVMSAVPMPASSAMVLIDGRLNKLHVPHAILGRVILEALDPESLADLAVAIRDDSEAHLRGARPGAREELLPAFTQERGLWA